MKFEEALEVYEETIKNPEFVKECEKLRIELQSRFKTPISAMLALCVIIVDLNISTTTKETPAIIPTLNLISLFHSRGLEIVRKRRMKNENNLI